MEKTTIIPEREETPVDDVRCIRERLDREADGNIHKLMEQAKIVANQYSAKLGLKVVQPPSRETRRDGTRG
jgi:hypothetical protein